MSWLFFPGGTIMPAMIPGEVLAAAKTPDIQEAVERGWDIQIRARLSEHLTWFCENFMPEGSYSDEVDVSGTDYNVRRYCRKEDLATGVFNATMDMDYVKFKDTSTRRNQDGSYRYGANSAKYHSVLMSVWSASGRLNSPYGGKDGTYKPKWSTYTDGFGLGSTFGQRATDDTPLALTSERRWWEEGDESDQGYEGYWDTDDEVSDLLSMLSDVPADQWEDFTDEREFALLKPYVAEAKELERRRTKKNKRNRKRNRKHAQRGMKF